MEIFASSNREMAVFEEKERVFKQMSETVI